MSSRDRAHFDALRKSLTRRSLLRGSMGLLGAGALASLLRPGRASALPHFTPTARRVVYMFMAGGPSQLETFDHKPGLAAREGEPLPDSVRNGQRVTGMSNPASLLVVNPRVTFSPFGSNGTMVSELFPQTGAIIDDLCLVKTLYTDAINHDPAITLMQTGTQLAGRPSMGAWATYGLGDATRDLPSFVVMVSRGGTNAGQPVSPRFWGSGFLPAQYQGVPLQGGPEPVLYLDDGSGQPASSRERLRDTRTSLDQIHELSTHDPEITARIEAFELAHTMQTSVPSLSSLGDEPASTFALYGDDARIPGTFAANCVMARRLLERDVPFIQMYHRDWDHHTSIQTDHPVLARTVDRAQAAFVTDLKQRGLLDDTLVIWGGEFGRTVYAQGAVTASQYGRDHHPRNFAIWMAGGGVRAGLEHGVTDDYSYNVVEGGIHVHDFHATVLHMLGFDHELLTYRSQGRDFRLTDVAGDVRHELLR